MATLNYLPTPTMFEATRTGRSDKLKQTVVTRYVPRNPKEGRAVARGTSVCFPFKKKYSNVPYVNLSLLKSLSPVTSQHHCL